MMMGLFREEGMKDIIHKKGEEKELQAPEEDGI